MQRPDLRTISGNIRDALDGCDRETLIDILTFVFKEYLVEGPPPVLVHQAERIEDLEGLSFAELIAALQTRLDVPELSLFQIENNQVSVRVGGVLSPLTMRAQRSQPPGATNAPAQRPQPGVRVVETELVQRPRSSGQRSTVNEAVSRGRHDLAGMAQDMVADQMRAESTAPPPRRGLSISGRTTGGAMMPGSPASTTPSAPRAPRPPAASDNASPENRADNRADNRAAPSPPADNTPEPPSSSDSASTRFSLLELD